MIITGDDYTKWLWGNQHTDGSVYNFTTVPGEGYGDNGQGTEIELLSPRHALQARRGQRPHPQSRFNQNSVDQLRRLRRPQPGLRPAGGDCVGGDCGEFDPRSNQYIKLRGLTVRFTPGYKWLDSATIGSTDLGMFDPFTIGKIRYIDRDNATAILLQGSLFDRKLTYDADRASRCRACGPARTSTPATTRGQDGAYGLQLKFDAEPAFDVGGIFELRPRRRGRRHGPTTTVDNGRNLTTALQNDVYGVQGSASIRARRSTSAARSTTRTADSNPELGAPAASA